MKLSAYHKELGNEVELVTDYKDLYYDENLWNNYQEAINQYSRKQTKQNSDNLYCNMTPCFKESNIKYDKIYISKVFTDTEIDEDFLQLSIVEYGGTGFFYDKAPKLPYEIEHHMPDYHLYDEWVQQRLDEGGNRNDFKYYLDYSIGFVTRGCFRQCQFCVNKNYKKLKYIVLLMNLLIIQERRYVCWMIISLDVLHGKISYHSYKQLVNLFSSSKDLMRDY